MEIRQLERCDYRGKNSPYGTKRTVIMTFALLNTGFC